MSKATEIVHWPGQDTPACDEHYEKLKALARVMGFPLSATPAIADEPCANCENEAKKAGQG